MDLRYFLTTVESLQEFVGIVVVAEQRMIFHQLTQLHVILYRFVGRWFTHHMRPIDGRMEMMNEPHPDLCILGVVAQGPVLPRKITEIFVRPPQLHIPILRKREPVEPHLFHPFLHKRIVRKLQFFYHVGEIVQESICPQYRSTHMVRDCFLPSKIRMRSKTVRIVFAKIPMERRCIDVH